MSSVANMSLAISAAIRRYKVLRWVRLLRLLADAFSYLLKWWAVWQVQLTSTMSWRLTLQRSWFMWRNTLLLIALHKISTNFGVFLRKKWKLKKEGSRSDLRGTTRRQPNQLLLENVSMTAQRSTLRARGEQAWVCPECNEPYLTPLNVYSRYGSDTALSRSIFNALIKLHHLHNTIPSARPPFWLAEACKCHDSLGHCCTLTVFSSLMTIGWSKLDFSSDQSVDFVFFLLQKVANAQHSCTLQFSMPTNASLTIHNHLSQEHTPSQIGSL